MAGLRGKDTLIDEGFFYQVVQYILFRVVHILPSFIFHELLFSIILYIYGFFNPLSVLQVQKQVHGGQTPPRSLSLNLTHK